MSRRAVLRQREEERLPPVTPVIAAVGASLRLARGQCPKCLVLYGRAMHGHIPHCSGVAAWPGIGPQPAPMINNGQVIERPLVAVAPIASSITAQVFTPPQRENVPFTPAPAPVNVASPVMSVPKERVRSSGVCPTCRESIYSHFTQHIKTCGVSQESRQAAYAEQRARFQGVSAPEPVEIETEKPPSKATGDCPNCGRHFAKGLHLHTRSCATVKAA